MRGSSGPGRSLRRSRALTCGKPPTTAAGSGDLGRDSTRRLPQSSRTRPQRRNRRTTGPGLLQPTSARRAAWLAVNLSLYWIQQPRTSACFGFVSRLECRWHIYTLESAFSWKTCRRPWLQVSDTKAKLLINATGFPGPLDLPYFPGSSSLQQTSFRVRNDTYWLTEPKSPDHK